MLMLTDGRTNIADQFHKVNGDDLIIALGPKPGRIVTIFPDGTIFKFICEAPDRTGKRILQCAKFYVE